jgi:hypothetical protein
MHVIVRDLGQERGQKRGIDGGGSEARHRLKNRFHKLYIKRTQCGYNVSI